MSFILDALNKAQREREEQRQPVPQLSTIHDGPMSLTPSQPIARGRLVVIALGAGASALLLAGGLWMFSGDGVQPSTDVGATSAQGQIARPAEGQPLRPLPDGTAETESRVIEAKEPAVVERAAAPAAGNAAPADTSPRGEAENISGLYANARDAVESESGATAASAGGEADVASAGVVTAPAGGNNEAAQPPQTVEPAAVVPDSIHERVELQYLQQLSWAVQQSLPSINYSAHDPDAAPANRSVVINGSTYRPGAQIGQGLVLEEVLTDGVVLRYRNQKFKLEALNSWVNF